MTYLDLLPIGRRINYKGLTYAVRALWNKGAVCRTDNGTSKILSGAAALEDVRPEARFLVHPGGGGKGPFAKGVEGRRFMVTT